MNHSHQKNIRELKMGSSAAAGQPGQPQKMPGGGQSSPIMDYSMNGGGRQMYGVPNQPGVGIPNPINDMTQPGGQFPMPGQGQGDYQQAVMPYPGQGNFHKPVMPGQGGMISGEPIGRIGGGGGGMRTYDLQPGDPGHPGMMPNRPGMMPNQPGGLIAAPPQQRPGGILDSQISRPTDRVQNPGMRTYDLQPGDRKPGGTPPSGKTRIDGGRKGKVYNPNKKPKGSFQGLSKGTMPSMKKHVQAGKMGQAKKAFEAGGGKWTKDVQKRLKKKYS